MEKYAPFVLHLELFLKCEIDLKGTKDEIMQELCLALL